MGGVGPFALAFNDAFLRSQENARRGRQADLTEAITLDEIHQRNQLNQDIGGLAGAFQARRAAMANQPPMAPPTPAGPPQGQVSADAMMGGTVPGVTPPMPTPAQPGPSGAPAGEMPRRQSLLESVDPAMAGRLLRSQQGRSALKDLETAEKEQEVQDNKKLAESIWGDATAAMKSGDTQGYYDNAAKAMRVMGNHESAAKYLEHAMNLRGDQEEAKKADADLSRWLNLQSAYTADPSPENYAALLEGLGEANSKASRALRVQLSNNILVKTFNQNPQVAGFSRAVAAQYRDALAEGKTPNAEQVFRDVAGKDPAGLAAYLYEALAKGQNLPEPLIRALGWETRKDIPKTISDKAFDRTRARFPSLRYDDPKFLEAWWADEVKMTKELRAETRGQSPEDARKELRADRSELRQRLNQIRAAIDKLDIEDKEGPRGQALLEEEAQVKADLDEAEKSYRGKSGTPEGKPAPVKTKVNPPSPKLAPDNQKYVDARRTEMRRLLELMPADQVKAEMKRAGWQ